MKKLTLLLCLSQVCSATVIYSFIGTSGGSSHFGPETFTLIWPTFILSDEIDIPVGPELSCNACGFIDMWFSHPGTIVPVDSREIGYALPGTTQDSLGGDQFYFPPGAFETPGVYNSFLVSENQGTLTVTLVPEAQSLSLFLIGGSLVLLCKKIESRWRLTRYVDHGKCPSR